MQSSQFSSSSSVNRQVITTEELQNFKNLVGNYNPTTLVKSASITAPFIPSAQPTSDKMTEILAKYLYQQQQQAKILSNTSIPSTFSRFPKSSNQSPTSVPTLSGKEPAASNNTGLVSGGGSRDFIPFKCPLCSLIYRTQAFLNEHMRKEHSVLI